MRAAGAGLRRPNVDFTDELDSRFPKEDLRMEFKHVKNFEGQKGVLPVLPEEIDDFETEATRFPSGGVGPGEVHRLSTLPRGLRPKAGRCPDVPDQDSPLGV